MGGKAHVKVRELCLRHIEFTIPRKHSVEVLRGQVPSGGKDSRVFGIRWKQMPQK